MTPVMASDLDHIRKEVRGETVEQSARTSWFRARTARILDKVEAHDVLAHFGVTVQVDSSQGQSLPCPFHGDHNPSARLHPANAKGPSHLWCYVCRKNWNAIQLWREFNHVEFTSAVGQMERFYGLPPIPVPRHGFQFDPLKTEEKDRLASQLEMLERMTFTRKEQLGFDRYLKFSVALDKLWFLLDSNPGKLEPLIKGYIEKLCPGISSSVSTG